MDFKTSCPKFFEIFGVCLPRITFKESFEKVYSEIFHKSGRLFFCNSHTLMQARQNGELLTALKQAEYVFNDGVGIDFAAVLWQGRPMPANLNGTDWIPEFLTFLEKHQYCNDSSQRAFRLFLIGSNSQIQDTIQQVFMKRWPGLFLCNIADGYVQDEKKILSLIQEACPDILIIGMGVPAQELFIFRHWERLQESGILLAIGGGAIFDFLSGSITRAPQFFRKLRMEWFFRFIQEPKRLGYRYFVEGMAFIWYVTVDRIKNLLT
jgi:exopolysaccharide biosynthesis WecB/TagA/CpsF family protein